MSIEKIHLLVIDPQKDFCDPAGSLFVPGAAEDIQRLAAMVNRIGDKLSDIHCTLDSHHLVDIAHPIWWKDRDGKNPDPFTIITHANVKDGVWTTSIPSFFKRSLEYVQKLEDNGRYPLCIWPPHCLIGSEGAMVVPELFDAFRNWEQRYFGMVDYVTKGSNPFTEHYSGVQADVPDPTDTSTMLNTKLIQTLEDATIILITGEAGSHCVANTVQDIADNFGSEDYVKKFVLLEDTVSPVPATPDVDFPQIQQDFIDNMKARGMRVSTSTEFLAA